MSRTKIALIGLALGMGGSISGCTEKEPPPPAEIVRPVKIVNAGGPEQDVTRDFPGTIKGAQNAEMGFEVPGRIVEFMVQEGQHVVEGTPLARLDDRDYQAELDKIRANLNKAKADLNRSENIYKQDPGAISQDQIESDRRAVGVQTATLAQTEKAVEDTVLQAPFEGLVSRRLVDNFENVLAKQPVLLIQDVDYLKIEVSVPERDFSASARRMSPEELTVLVDPRVEVSSVPGRRFPARLTELATAADPVTRTFKVTMAFDNPKDLNILPGMTARVTVTAIREPGTWLPSHAVVADSGAEPYVWKVDPQSMAVSRNAVEVGAMREGSIQITAGLADEDLVAISGVRQLADGQRVRRFQN